MAGSSGRDIFALCSYSHSASRCLTKSADRHQANDPLMADDREMAKPSIGHFFHGHMNVLVLPRRDHSTVMCIDTGR